MRLLLESKNKAINDVNHDSYVNVQVYDALGALVSYKSILQSLKRIYRLVGNEQDLLQTQDVLDDHGNLVRDQP